MKTPLITFRNYTDGLDERKDTAPIYSGIFNLLVEDVESLENSFSQDNILYVGKHGSDSNTGKSTKEAFLTISKALLTASSETPAADNRIAIQVVDAGSYVEDLTVPEWCGVIAPAALIQGNHILNQNALIDSFRLVTTSGTCITKSSGTGQGSINCPKMILTGSAAGLLCTAGTVNFNGQDIAVENGYGIGSLTTSNIHVRLQNITVNGTGIAIGINAAGHITGSISCIEDTGSGTGVYVGDSGTINLHASRIACNTAYNIASVNATLNLVCSNLSGTQTNNGTMKYISSNSGGSISGDFEIGDKVSGNYAKFNSDGELRLYGDTTQWEDLRVPVISTKLGGTKDPDFVKVFDDGGTSQGVFTYAFNKNTEEELYFAVQLPHGWMQGSDIKAHVHWFGSTNGGVGTDVCWGLEYTWANIGATFGNTAIIYGDTNDLEEDIVADKHYLTELGSITATNKTFSSMILCRVFRDAAGVGGTDDYDYDANLLEIDFHYQIDSLGSNEEYTKY